MDNLEGISWGLALTNGSRVLLVSDNNFNPAEVTPFIALCQERSKCDADVVQMRLRFYSAGLRLKSGQPFAPHLRHICSTADRIESP